MKRWWPRRTAAAREQLIAELERVPLDVTARACCCPARPVVTVMMPPTASRPHPVDLLLCGHHFRVSQASLRAAGADVYDNTGLQIMSGTSTAGTAHATAGGLVRTGSDHRTLCDDRAVMPAAMVRPRIAASRRAPGAPDMLPQTIAPELTERRATRAFQGPWSLLGGVRGAYTEHSV